MRFWSRPPCRAGGASNELVTPNSRPRWPMGFAVTGPSWEGDDAIGSIDLSLIRDGSAELGFVLRPDRWGQAWPAKRWAR